MTGGTNAAGGTAGANEAAGISGPYRRRSARVLLVDEDDRLLLFRTWTMRGRVVRRIPLPRRGPRRAWFTPGGGVEGGEPLPVAAARELREETGLVVAPEELGEPVAYTAGYAELDWASGTFRDDFFFHRTVRHEVDTSGFQALERGMTIGHRWWTVAELTRAGATEPVYPLGLTPLLEDLLAGRRPATPVELPWHH